MLKKITYCVVVLASVCMLVGCHSRYKALPGAYQNAANGSAESYGLAGQTNYGGKRRYDDQGRVINSLAAPSNQTYYFAFDSNTVNEQDLAAIRAQANYLATHAHAKVRLEGNTDNRGSREYNVGLAWRRDQAIARIFAQQGVLPQQLDMVSYGKERPAVEGDNEHAWMLNRRVNLVYEAY